MELSDKVRVVCTESEHCPVPVTPTFRMYAKIFTAAGQKLVLINSVR